MTATCSSAIRSSRTISAASSSISRAALVAVELLHFFQLFDDDFAQLGFSEPRMDSYSVMPSRTSPNSFEISSIESLVRRCNCNSRIASAWRAVKGLSASSLGARPVVLMSIFLPPKYIDQIFAGVGAVGAAANDGDHVVQVIERGQVAFENVLAVFRLLQQVGGAAAHHVDAVIDEVFDGLDQAHFAGLAVDHRQQDHARNFPASAVCLKSWFRTICGSAPRFSSMTMRMPSRSLSSRTSEMSSMSLSLTSCAMRSIRTRFVHLIRNLGDDDGFAILAESLDRRLGAHHEAAAAGAVSLENSRSARG